jgi:hypothetical protein
MITSVGIFGPVMDGREQNYRTLVEFNIMS